MSEFEISSDLKYTLDKQFDELPKEVIFCKNCVVSNQRPRTVFNKEGICSACQWAFEKDHKIDWKEREKELVDLLDRFRSTDGSFDCVVPGSGGKDSAYVAHQLRTRYNMNPLCVTWAPFDWTDIGWLNLRNFVGEGFTNIIGQPGGQLHRKLTRLAFELKGDAWEPFTYGQKAWAFHIAEKFNVKLIFYGENGELEYGGSEKYKNLPKEGPEEWEKEYFKGASVDDLFDHGIKKGILTKEDFKNPTYNLYKAPNPELVIKKGIEMHWYSYYESWTPQENFYYAARYTAFKNNPQGRSEGTYTKHVSLDDKADGFHWLLSYMKFGMCRCSRDVQTDIRRHHITRDEGVILVNRYDAEFPQRHFKWFLDYCNISEEFFWEVMDLYREKSNVWKKINGEWKMLYPVV
ncbi:MAG: N-acetyl sugar amidotransferase [Halobacteriovoraceae bacterium]|jgi:N-acetyl sugar amidotransferase|nr:N-acetyl sugar amidotransferase [Halobacteriovoraceae bacterium]